MQTIVRIENLPFRLSKEQRSWLNKMRKSKNEEIRSIAEWAWELRFPPGPVWNIVDAEPDEDTELLDIL